MASATLAELRRVTYKDKDAWWTVLLVDPIAVHLLRLAAGVRWITPNRITVAAFVLGLASAGCFAVAGAPWLIAGALVYHVAFVLDCVDGKLARWQNSGTAFGAWMDFILDEVRVAACTIALMGGLFLATDRAEFLLLGIVIVFLEMFRYVNGAHMDNVRASMRAQLDRLNPPAGTPVDIEHSFRRRFPAALRARDWLVRQRIRPHPFSGIEFQMTIFIVGPIAGALLGAGAIVVVTIAACALTALVEVGYIYRFWLSTRDFRRAMTTMTAMTAVPDARPAAATPAGLPGQRMGASAGSTEPGVTGV